MYIKKRADLFLNRRPHRSFRITGRRDYARSLKLPGYFSFSNHVFKTLWTNRKLFLLLSVFFALLTVSIVGLASQDSYETLVGTLEATSGGIFSGGFGEIGKASLLFLSASTGGISQSLSEVQQVYAVIITLFTWLISVWLLRNIMAGNKVKLRDGIYSAGSPIISTLVVFLVFLVQLLPVALALIGYGAATSTGLLEGGFEAMLFWIAAALFSTLSFYWVTSTFIAMVIVTLPGMYPFKALKIAGDLVVGRRLRILLRIAWMILITVILWAITMIPIILVDKWIKSIWAFVSWVPTVPIALLAMTSLTIIWISSYIYLLYRRIVADDAKPA